MWLRTSCKKAQWYSNGIVPLHHVQSIVKEKSSRLEWEQKLRRDTANVLNNLRQNLRDQMGQYIAGNIGLWTSEKCCFTERHKRYLERPKFSFLDLLKEIF